MYENRLEFRIKISEGGRMIIPAAYRKAMNLHPGDELVARLDKGELRLFQQTQALKRIRALVKHTASNHVKAFLDFRKKDSEK